MFLKSLRVAQPVDLCVLLKGQYTVKNKYMFLSLQNKVHNLLPPAGQRGAVFEHLAVILLLLLLSVINIFLLLLLLFLPSVLNSLLFLPPSFCPKPSSSPPPPPPSNPSTPFSPKHPLPPPLTSSLSCSSVRPTQDTSGWV